MNSVNMIDKANQIIKNANFTKLKNVTKVTKPCFLIAVIKDGQAIYGQHNSQNYFVSVDNVIYQLA